MTAVRYRIRRLLRVEVGSNLALVGAVTVVATMVLTLVAGAFRTQSAPDRYQDALGDRYDTALEQTMGEPLDEEIEALPAVAEVVSLTFFFGALAPEGGSQEELVEGITFAGTHEAFLSDVIAGRAPDPDVPTEFAASTSWLEEAGAEIGDRFQLFTISAESAQASGFDAEPDGPMSEVTLVGEVAGVADLQDQFPLAIFPPGLLAGGDIGTSASQMLISLADGATLGTLREQLDGLADGDQISLNQVDAVPPDFREAASTQTAAIVVVAVIAAAAGLVVVGQLAVRRVRASADQRLALRALGYTRVQVLLDAAGRIGLPGFVGTVLASGLAYAASGLFPTGFTERVEPVPGLRFDPLVLLVGPIVLALGLVATVGVILVLRDRGRRPKVTPVDRVSAQLGQAKAAVGLRFAFARHARDAGSLSTPLLGLVLLVTTLVGAATFGASFDDFLDDPTRWGHPFDLSTGQGGFERVPDELQAAVLADPDVDSLTLLGAGGINVGERAVDLTGVETVDGDLGLEVLSGAPPSDDDEIALGALTADDFDVGVGDDLELPGVDGPRTFTVSGIAVMPGVEGTEGVGRSGLLTAAGLATLDDESEMSAMAIGVREGASVPEVRERLTEDLGIAVGQFERPSVITDYDRVRAAPWIVAGLLAVLLVLTVTNLVVVTLSRRGRDIAVLRALGADRRWISRVEHWHALAIGLVVGLLSAVLGVAAGRLVFRTRIADRIGVSADTLVPLLWIGVGVVALVLAVDLVAQVAVRWRHASVARRLSVE